MISFENENFEYEVRKSIIDHHSGNIEKLIGLTYHCFRSRDLTYRNKNFYRKGEFRIVMKIILRSNEIPSEAPSSSTWKYLDETMILTDLTIITSCDEVLKAHKSILSARSDVFKAMFTNNTKENQTGVIEMKATLSNVVKDFLSFIYCDTSSFRLKDAVGFETELYNVAEKYEIEDLKCICLEAIYEKLDEYYAMEFIEFAHKFDLEDLFSCCLLLIFA
jgi:hypothetical protein